MSGTGPDTGSQTRALLLASGLGTRLRPLTDTVPKCLVPVAGRPMLDYWCDALEAAGISEVLINTHHLAGQVRSFIASASAARDLNIHEAFEPELLGSAGTVHANRDWMDGAGDCLIIYTDNLSTIDLAAFGAFHRSHAQPLSMALFHTSHPQQCGIATLDPDGLVTDFIEKPAHPASDLANAGLYMADAETWREIADMDVFDFGMDVLPHFVGRMQGYGFDGYHRDIGTPAALAQAERDARQLFGDRP